MNAPNPQHEPTMEEILASIRKIISEDQPDSGAQSGSAAEPEAPAKEPHTEPAGADVLELTEEVREEAPTAEPELPQPEPPQPPVLENDIAFEPIEERESRPMEPDDLISDVTHDAVGRAFAPLDEIRERHQAATGSLDAVFTRAVQDAFAPLLQEWVDAHQSEITDRLKPMIREWMDEHLPSLIEAAVAKEINRTMGVRKR
jgi:uncharacterized protein